MTAYPTIKKECKRCQKPFLTKNKELEFCNTECESKYKYAQHFKITEKAKFPTGNCKQCGETTFQHNHYCNEHCKKLFAKNKRIAKNKEIFVKDKKSNLKRLPYDVLNQIEEKKRIFDDSWWNYNRNYERI